MIPRLRIRGCLLAVLSWGASLACAFAAESKGTGCGWRVGDSWELWVQAYAINWAIAYHDPERQAANQKDQPGDPLPMRVVVRGSSIEKNETIWQLEFIPEDVENNPLYDSRCRVWVNDSDGSLRRVHHWVGRWESDFMIDRVGTLTMMEHVFPGFPIQMLGLPGPTPYMATNDAAGQRVSLARTPLGAVDCVEAKLDSFYRTGPASTVVLVRQSWSPGAKWWNSYVCYLRGRLNTVAWLKSDANPPRPTGAVKP